MENTSGGGFETVLTAVQINNFNESTPVRFVGVGQALSGTGKNRVEFETPPRLTNGIVLQSIVVDATTNRVDFATIESTAFGAAIVALPDAMYETDINRATITSNVRLSTTQALTLDRTINSLLLTNGADLSGPYVLRIDRGGIAIEDGGSTLGADMALQLGNDIHYNIFTESGTTTIDSRILGVIGGGNIYKSGAGKLVLTGDNFFGQINGASGGIVVNEGTLNVQRSTALGTAAGIGTFVRANAVLELEKTLYGDINISTEALSLDGTGGVANGGALRNIAGNNSWAGTITQAGNTTNLTGILGGFPVTVSSTTHYDVAAGSSLNVSGAIVGNLELIKSGAGTLELSGVFNNTSNQATRILEGTLLLNKEPGINAITTTIEVGSNVNGAPMATLKLGASDQIPDGVLVRVHASGLFDLNNQSEAIDQLQLVSGQTNSADVTLGTGTLTIARQGLDNHFAIYLLSVGKNNAVSGSTITGGTLALNVFGSNDSAAARLNRRFEVNDATNGTDLTITSAIANGSDLLNMGLEKRGFGSLELGGTTANTFTGTTSIVEGTLLLNKTPGVNAMSGPLSIGDGNVTNGFAKSDVVRWLQS